MSSRRRERIAGTVLLLGFVYLAFEAIAAMAWVDPPYDWAVNYVSDLGFSDCATVDGDRICSPLHPLMNAAFLIQGTVFTVGGILVVSIVFPPGTRRRVIGAMLAASGIGTFLVGVFHQSLALSSAGLNWLHVLAATLAIGAGDIALVLLGAFATPVREWRGYGMAILVIGLIGVLGAILLIVRIDFGAGFGLIERIAIYPLNTWTVGTAIGLLVKSARARRRSAARRAAPVGS